MLSASSCTNAPYFRPSSTSSFTQTPAPLPSSPTKFSTPATNAKQFSWPPSTDDMTSFSTVINLNIQGLCGLGKNSGNQAKLDVLRHLNNAASKPDIICLSETKLSNYLNYSEIELFGYCVNRRDRNQRRSGVAMYYRSSLKVVSLELKSLTKLAHLSLH